jgi:hypothetical protein
VRPLYGSGYQSLLNGIFGGGEVPVPAKRGSEHLRREFPQQMPEAMCCHAS